MDETRDRHPSCGMISAARWQASGRGRRLFGSALPGHNSGIALRIHEAVAIDRDGHVRPHARNLIAEVHLSPVQWAELLTSMNMDGVPCTIGRVLNYSYEEPPARTGDPERIREHVAYRLRARADAVRDARAAIAAKIAGRVSGATAKEIDGVLRSVEVDIRENIPWYAEVFHEETERVVTSAKAEVDAFLTNAAHSLGMKALKMGGVRALLGAPEDVEP